MVEFNRTGLRESSCLLKQPPLLKTTAAPAHTFSTEKPGVYKFAPCPQEAQEVSKGHAEKSPKGSEHALKDGILGEGPLILRQNCGCWKENQKFMEGRYFLKPDSMSLEGG